MGTLRKRHADVGARNGSRKSRSGGRPLAAEAERVALIGPGELRNHTLALYALLLGDDPDSRAIFVRTG